MKINYSTADSRLAAYIVTQGVPLMGTETKYHGQDDRVMLIFDVEEDLISQLKREFFEGSSAPALELCNAMKMIMHTIREARELARENDSARQRS